MRSRKKSKYYRLNYQITAAQIRLLDEKGKQIGIVDKNEALKRAQAEKKDLVEIAPKAQPPVVKLIDFKKFKYLEAKRLRELKKRVKNVGVKEIRLSPFMGKHDFQTRISQGENFLKAGNQLKISVPFKGRQLKNKEFGSQIMKRALTHLQTMAKITKPPSWEGRVLAATMTPIKLSSQLKNKKNAKAKN